MRGIARWPKYNTWITFCQQLTTYGFDVVGLPPQGAQGVVTYQFSHPRFLKGKPDLLRSIQYGERPNTTIPEDHHPYSPLPVFLQSIPQQIPPNSPPGRMPDVNLLSDRIFAVRDDKHRGMTNRLSELPAGVKKRSRMS